MTIGNGFTDPKAIFHVWVGMKTRLLSFFLNKYTDPNSDFCVWVGKETITRDETTANIPTQIVFCLIGSV